MAVLFALRVGSVIEAWNFGDWLQEGVRLNVDAAEVAVLSDRSDNQAADLLPNQISGALPSANKKEGKCLGWPLAGRRVCDRGVGVGNFCSPCLDRRWHVHECGSKVSTWRSLDC